MDILFNVVSGFVVKVGKFGSKFIFPKIVNTIHFSSEVENLRKEMEKLTKLRDDHIKEKVEVAKREGYKPKPDVLKWLQDVQKLENEWESMQENIATAKIFAYKCCPKWSLRSKISTLAQNRRDQLCALIEIGENFGSNLVVETYKIQKAEFIPGPSIEEGQSVATRNLNEILQLLEDDKVCTIGVWGIGGVGKTTLVMNVNNELLKIAASSSELSFDVVVWVTVPKPPTDIRKVQAQIANRLNLKVDSEESVESIASRIHQRLNEGMSFLLILDDVWEAINLDHIGVPQPEDHPRCKVIITSRFLDVCRQMRTDKKIKVYTLDEDESWHMFVKNAGDIANLEHIQPFAKEIAMECDGLPLAITVIGASMRGKTRIELWKDALESLRRSEPHNKDVNNKVYKVIKWSFDCLDSEDIQSCFLYCSLYPEAISTADLIHCWWAEGLLGHEYDTYEQAYNRGIIVIESLKDVCLLDAHEWDSVKMLELATHKLNSVKMHDVVRDVAIWIAKSFGDEHNSLIQAGMGLTDISNIKMSASVKRISFVSNKIERLPDCFLECPETTTLLLQDNVPLRRIPHDYFLAFPAIRVLNLSNTSIRALPFSIDSLSQLRALVLQNCCYLTELPAIGNLRNLQLLDCDNTRLHRLPPGMDELTDLRVLYLPATDLENIREGILLKLSNIEMLNMLDTKYLWGRSYPMLDELSYLHKLTCLIIKLDRSSVSNRDHTWMSRLKRFHIEVGEAPMPFSNSTRMIGVSECEIFSRGQLSGMLQFASLLYLTNCNGLSKLIGYNNNFYGLKSLHISGCHCYFKPMEEGNGQFDPLPNLESLRLYKIFNLKSVSDFGHLLGLRFSKLRQLDVYDCRRLTCLFKVDGPFPVVPKHLEEIDIICCAELEELFVPFGSSQTTLKVRKLVLKMLPELRTLGEPQSTWEHLEELGLMDCDRIRKLPISIQTSKNIKVIRGDSYCWNQLEWDDDSFKSNLEHCFLPRYY
ncbi:probable disease resistance protein At4g27220 [Nicotiana tomentosiformis]|uniref:probable disease resistance protein At4g27220 n=1 Tax=Nicotiana tomentosiformis TaxID=4098 RepID=UPI00051B9068|nr:probable disease resistance protein At4g27220 isoform X1 [Nicotiana tomentosiformis]